MIKEIRKNKNGFTLAELLIVVAIVGVLVAISIPIFTSQLHKARVATDWANVRAYYAELTYEFQQTGKYDDSKEHAWGGSGVTEITISGETVKLKTGQLWVSPAYDDDYAKDKKIIGYNLLYMCNNYDNDHTLILG